MEKFQLSILFKIIGIGSASGLVYHEDKIYIISDNSSFLYEYGISNHKINKISLVENAKENILKKDKSDFEAITIKGDNLIILGSGSTEKRNQIFKYNIKTKKTKEESFVEFYGEIKSKLSIKDDELNIEGLIVTEINIYLFQRGNGENSKNGIIYADDDPENPNFKFIPFELPKIKNIEATFTDAILVENKIYFLASAEDTTSTYDDGEVLGSIIGCIDAMTFKVEFTNHISNKHKFEGLTLYKKTATHLELLLCEDNDTDILETVIYSLILKR